MRAIWGAALLAVCGGCHATRDEAAEAPESSPRCTISIPEPGSDEAWVQAVNALASCPVEVDGVVLPGDVRSFSFETIFTTTRALDQVGLRAQAEACLEVLWRMPLPESLAAWGQNEEGLWTGPSRDPNGQGLALAALASHYLLTRDEQWIERSYPAILKGAEWVRAAITENGGILPGTPRGDAGAPGMANPNECAQLGLRLAAAVADATNKTKDGKRMREAASWIDLGLRGPIPKALLDPSLPPVPSGRSPAETVPFGHWAYDAVDLLVDEGLIAGGKPRRPGQRHARAITRYEFAMTISRLLDPPPDLQQGKVISADEVLAVCRQDGPDSPDVSNVCATLLREFLPEILDLMDQLADLSDDVDGFEYQEAAKTGEGAIPTHADVHRLRELITEIVDSPTPPTLALAVEYISVVRGCVLDDAGGKSIPMLLPKAPRAWLDHGAGIDLVDVPARSGPISFRAGFREADPTLTLNILAPRAREGLMVNLCAFAGMVVEQVDTDPPDPMTYVDSEHAWLRVNPHQEPVRITVHFAPANG